MGASTIVDQRCNAVKVASCDGSQKYTFLLPGGIKYEAVFFRVQGRLRPNIACVSTQIGCAVGCIFCATASESLYRDLTAEQISLQVDTLLRDQDVTRTMAEGFEVSFMGMGEPLANLRHVVRSIEAISRRYPLISRVSLSTVGPAHRIDRLTQFMPSAIPLHLQVSLHATNDSVRSELVPRAPCSITELLRAARNYHQKTGDHVCLNYILIEGKNDSESDAAWLADLDCDAFYLKLSTLNPVPHLPENLMRKSREGAMLFARRVAARGVKVNLFQGDGLDIQASCGQLASSQRLVNIHSQSSG